MEVYRRDSDLIREIFSHFADAVEPISIDEAFLDVTTSSMTRNQTATRLAAELKNEIKKKTGLTASAGVAPNKFLAKVASDMRKPDGLTVVQPHEIESFLSPLAVGKIPGVGPATNQRLRHFGIRTIKDLRERSRTELVAEFGKMGLAYYRLSRGLDERPVQGRGQAKSLSTETTFSYDVRDPEELTAQLERQADELMTRLRQSGLSGTTAVLKLRYADFETVTRSRTVSLPFAQAETIVSTALDLLERTDYRERAVRLLGLGVSNLISAGAPTQLFLF